MESSTLQLRYYSPADLPSVSGQSETFKDRSVEVHVWSASWEELREHGAPWQSYLSEDEQARARRFLRAQDAERYRLGRGWLRRLLGHYLKARPELLRIEYGRHGKPYVLEFEAPSALQFNLAHSGNLFLVACSRYGELGVDLEAVCSSVGCEALVQRFFSRREQIEFATLPGGLRCKAFFRAWTCKEACLKALGTGLATPLDRFEVALAPDANLRIRADTTNHGLPDGWFLHSWTPCPGYAAALALRGPKGASMGHEISTARYVEPLTE